MIQMGSANTSDIVNLGALLGLCFLSLGFLLPFTRVLVPNEIEILWSKAIEYYEMLAVNGPALVTVKSSDAQLKPYGIVHGGSTSSLIDSCMGLAVHSTLEKGFGQTTVEFKISLLRPITPEIGRIRAEGIVLNCGRRIGTGACSTETQERSGFTGAHKEPMRDRDCSSTTQFPCH